MRILLLTQLFQPEPNHLKGLNFARGLANMGHEIEVLTGFPNYPQGYIYPGYRQRWRFKEIMEGIPVIRVPLYPSHNSSGLLRFINYVSFMLTATAPGLFSVQRPDVVHVYLGPATLAVPAMVLRLLLRVPYILDIQDLWPESVTSSGMLKIPGGGKIIDLLCRITYRYASKIIVLSPGYKSRLEMRGVDPAKIEVIYNWSDETVISNRSCHEEVLKRFDQDGRFKLIYAGNLGPLQALDAVLEAAALLKTRNSLVRLTFVGDGAEADQLKKKALERALTNVDFIPRQSPSVAACLIAAADAALVHLRDDDLGRIGIPQKVQAYMALGIPVLLAMKGDAADLISRAEAGVVSDPENPESIAAAIDALCRMPREEKERLGRNGRAFYKKTCSFEVGLRRTAAVLFESRS